MTIRIYYVLKTTPNKIDTRTFCGSDATDCQRQLEEWINVWDSLCFQWNQQ